MLRHNVLIGMPIYKLILGFGLCTLGGAMLYTYFKNRDEDKDVSQPKPAVKQKRKPQQARLSSKRVEEEVKINFEILNEHIPLCVGRGGSNLKSIEQQTSTKIYLR